MTEKNNPKHEDNRHESAKNINSAQDFDVVISGGGIAGCSLALALKNSGLRIALLEAQPSKPAPQGLAHEVEQVTPRVSALSLAAQKNLAAWGAWSLIDEQRLGFYQRMHVWDAQGNAALEFSAAEVQQTQLGCIVENNVLVAALHQALSDVENVTVMQPVKLTALSQNTDDSWVLSLDSQQHSEIHARLLVAADGANSFVRQQLNIALREWDYPHHAIVATVETELEHQHTAWQRFLSSGPLAFLPLSGADNKLSSIVWSLEYEQVENILALDDQQFSQALELAFESRLGKINKLSKRFSFPLRQRHAVDYVQPGLALIADAAHTIHPLAGQGINLGLEDVRVLSEEIIHAAQRGINFASQDTLKRYQRRRKVHNLGMMAAVESFTHLFATEDLKISWLRNEGMRLFSRFKPLKKEIIKRAMGL